MRKRIGFMILLMLISSAAVAFGAAWVQKQGLGTARWDHFVATDGTEKIYVFGGRSSMTGYLSTAEVYDISLNAWSALPVMPGPLLIGSAAMIGTEIYMPGGFDGAIITNTFYSFDTSGNTYDASLAPLPANRYAYSLEVIDGLLYLCGGGADDVDETPQADCWTYDPVGDEWTAIADMPDGRKFHGSGVIDGLMYVYGGLDPAISEANTLFVYDPGLDSWTTAQMMTFTWWGGISVVVNDELFAALGQNSGVPIGDGFTYNATDDAWTDIGADSPTPRFRLKGASADGFPWAVGGAKINFLGTWIPFATVEYFDPDATTTTTTTTIPPPTTTTTTPATTTTTTIPADDDVTDDTGSDDTGAGGDDDDDTQGGAGGDDDDDSGGCCG